ncbi:ATP adenylyltransferase, C-terminal [Penicillium digitatum]|uniref:Zn(2)-C6 fungal-type domain-containing protein n=3 Tax=Penicillium digitatum TaxID=36651 RepID=K9G163_PEND2|nr:hypothetical protein PDIP_74150 [Penicillium digitatum Pd1]EKV07324.1 hypothetical protein PDIP_74150 [Penicillium digitatum Pd1]EKV08618.1 hypothetical protein PDIG_64820 [Penicillium digitatum PHI26]KAG0159337.1 hypothetical protein PDIDSM_6859 [Penicillium digitatum]QQK41174.1 ATP adenylyltransferase, C-terminal [Penicillium digitatum]
MSRLAACEACRKAKLACDHQLPVCTRCSANKGICIYRTTPFKRKRVEKQSLDSPDESPSFNPRRNPYPNPGYLGSSSHAAIFKHITPDGDQGLGNHQVVPEDLQSDLFGDNHLVLQGADILKHLLTTYKLSAMTDLVMFWLVKGANLALAEPFVEQCAQSVSQLFTYHDDNWHLIYARRLLQNSAQPLHFNDTSDLASFSAQFLDHNSRWETLGIFFAAVSRATIDIAIFPSLYTTEQEQYTLRRLCTKLCDFALEISLSLDCLNDLQLVMQYENFIVHSYVDGDQSYHSWRKLGDAISSTFALGYHENIEIKAGLPPFLKELRKTAFARIYSADKNVAIFLGRPPRMNKRFCHFQIPSCRNAKEGSADWTPDAEPGYRADTRWSALCASLKEEIWELLQDKHHPSCAQRASVIQCQAEEQWQHLPAHFRLEGSLKKCTQGPFGRDFVAGVRLHHLHVLFLLRLLLLKSPTEPDLPTVETAGQMLTLVVEIILLRDQLTNSGTGLIWKVAYYGLPAAGIMLLAMLKQHMPRAHRTRSLQDLSVFVAEVQIGTIVKPGDPNYPLLSKATRTIQRFLDSTHSDPAHSLPEMAGLEGNEEWTSLLSQDLWDFEAGFWQNLADHPSLVVIEPSLPPV